MKKTILILLFTQLSVFSFSQFVARVDLKEDIEGICDIKNVYTLLSMFKDQKEAVCTVKDPEIEKMLNDSVLYIKDKPDYKDKGIVSIIINCKGKWCNARLIIKQKTLYWMSRW